MAHSAPTVPRVIGAAEPDAVDAFGAIACAGPVLGAFNAAAPGKGYEQQQCRKGMCRASHGLRSVQVPSARGATAGCEPYQAARRDRCSCSFCQA